jgi:hypothetical protein
MFRYFPGNEGWSYHFAMKQQKEKVAVMGASAATSFRLDRLVRRSLSPNSRVDYDL